MHHTVPLVCVTSQSRRACELAAWLGMSVGISRPFLFLSGSHQYARLFGVGRYNTTLHGRPSPTFQISIQRGLGADSKLRKTQYLTGRSGPKEGGMFWSPFFLAYRLRWYSQLLRMELSGFSHTTTEAYHVCKAKSRVSGLHRDPSGIVPGHTGKEIQTPEQLTSGKAYDRASDFGGFDPNSGYPPSAFPAYQPAWLSCIFR